jgi:acetolactate synthase-1/2/3 large subunit
LIHIDINPNVFNKNYTATIAIEGDAKIIIPEISKSIKSNSLSKKRYRLVSEIIKKEKRDYFESWMRKKQPNIVSPGFFFSELQEKLNDDTIMVVDDGKHTFLTAELFSVQKSRHFISPTDFNCMGYSVPAAIGTKISHPDKTVVTIVGDGAFLMTGMELLTASMLKLGVIVFIFHDGELGQISQFQKIPLNRKTASILGDVQFEGIAKATGAHYIKMDNDNEISEGINTALEISRGKTPVLVDVNIDYSKKTYLTKGVVKTNLGRFPTREKLRFIGRALKRHITG